MGNVQNRLSEKTEYHIEALLVAPDKEQHHASIIMDIDHQISQIRRYCGYKYLLLPIDSCLLNPILMTAATKRLFAINTKSEQYLIS